MKKIIIVFAFLLSVTSSNAQTVTGYVSDSVSGESLVGAHILTASGNTATTTNAYGFFTLRVHQKDSLIISYVGYKEKVISVSSVKSPPILIQLAANAEISEVVIKAQKSIRQKTQMGKIDFSPGHIKTLPALAGETDILKSLQLMPGVKPMGEGRSSFMVRGGSPDQNKILIDDVPVYYINHLGGFVSVFNTDAIKKVNLYKGPFPAKYGGRLSSITDIKTKDGNLRNNQASITLGLVSSKFTLEGPVKKDTLSYYISLRRFMYDLITRPLTYLTNDKRQTGYTFYDLNTKLNYKPDSKNRFYWSFYSGHDKMLTKQKMKKEENALMKNVAKWGNLASSLRWNHLYGAKLFSNFTFYYMQYKYRSDFEHTYERKEGGVNIQSNLLSGIKDIALKTDFEYYPLADLNFTFGTRHIHHTYIPNNYKYSQPQTTAGIGNQIMFTNTPRSSAFENNFYIESHFSPFRPVAFNLGYRLSTLTTGKKTYISHEPRLSISTNLTADLALKASYTQMTQYVHLLSYFGQSIPADLWMPSTETVPPQNAQMFSAGLHKAFEEKNMLFRIEGYYKKMNNLIDFKQGHHLFRSDQDWTEAIEQGGTGTAKGIEFLLQRKSGRLTGWISYTLSETTRQFDNLNHGKPFPYTYDATHDISLVCSYNLRKNLTVSASWVYITGRAITVSNEYFYAPALRMQNEEYTFEMDRNENNYPAVNYDRVAYNFSERNAVRMHPYHRLDISLTYRFHKKKSDRVLNVGLYNAYNKQNPVYYYTRTKEIKDENGNPTGMKERKIYQMSLFPVIPSVSYSWIW
jgi:hypothetical protein